MKSNDKYIEKQKELYKRICGLENIDGRFEFDGFTITWHRDCNVYLEIGTETIVAYKNKFFSITHWHPDDIDEIIEEIKLCGTKGHILVLFSSLGCGGIIYEGPAEQYKSKWILGRKYIFGTM